MHLCEKGGSSSLQDWHESHSTGPSVSNVVMHAEGVEKEGYDQGQRMMTALGYEKKSGASVNLGRGHKSRGEGLSDHVQGVFNYIVASIQLISL